MQIILGLLGLLGVAGVAIFGLINKTKILDLINKNSKVIDQVKDLAATQSKDNTVLGTEEQARQDLQTAITKQQNEITDQANILEFFNKDKK